ncbi:GNAT family N-acetyltransferase [uncultured Bacteroides sp.]|uniref:GNAT family N-acetyltransferase n=1 Tax=uncultured Bacteroides sp. TaxID=162156 RepID=UPI002AA72527|nr:GNAT family N-acetyltransferase [uncultured Bacteroides sp.]
MVIRNIREEDDEALASIIRRTLEEFGANHPGTVYFDEAINRLSKMFQTERSTYFVVSDEENNKILGGGGIYPTEGLPADTAELVKLYLLPETRGKGFGKSLINKCLSFAKQAGYSKVYLESMDELSGAVGLYERLGFSYLNAPMGNTGHCYCGIWMMKEI